MVKSLFLYLPCVKIDLFHSLNEMPITLGSQGTMWDKGDKMGHQAQYNKYQCDAICVVAIVMHRKSL